MFILDSIIEQGLVVSILAPILGVISLTILIYGILMMIAFVIGSTFPNPPKEKHHDE